MSYTGYDMEDACIISKMSQERGIMYGTIYKTKIIDMNAEEKLLKSDRLTLGCVDPNNHVEVRMFRRAAPNLSLDGLPYVGSRIRDGEPLYCYHDPDENKYSAKMYQSTDNEIIVQSVRIFAQNYQNKKTEYHCGIREAAVMFRIARPVSIGDKVFFEQ